MNVLAWRWLSAVVLIGAGFAAGIATHSGWWVAGAVALAAALDRFWWRRHES